MSVEREGVPVSNNSAELEDLIRRLEEYHGAAMAQNIEKDELKFWTDEQHDAWGDIFSDIKGKVLEFSSSNIYEMQLKARAVKMIIELHNGGENLDCAIEEADSFESVALSLVRDVLKIDA